MTTTRSRQEIAMSGDLLSRDFRNASGESNDLETVIVMLLQRNGYALADLSQGLKDGLLGRALELHCVDAAGKLLTAGACIDNLKTLVDPGPDLKLFKFMLERAVEISTSSESAPVHFHDNMKKAKEGLKKSFTKLGW